MHTIIGAGIGGLTTALAFEKLNIPYKLYEKSTGLNALGAGIWLAPNALKVFEWLGILNQIQEGGNAINRITITKSGLQPITDSPQDIVKQQYGYSTVAIHRATLQKILCKNIPSSKIIWGKGLHIIVENENNVTLTFDDTSKIETDFLIGADGINSVVRKYIFPNSVIRYSGQTCWRGICKATLNDSFDTRGIEMWGNGVRFGLSKVSKDTFYWFAVAKSIPHQKEISKETLLKMYASYSPEVLQLIKETGVNKILKNDIIDLKPIKKWHTNKICLIGDAAHATTPNMGQGGAQAIEDAYFLAKFVHETSETNPFNSFQKKRYKKVTSIVNQSWQTGKIAHWKTGASFRNFLFKNLPKSIINKKMNEIYTLEE